MQGSSPASCPPSAVSPRPFWWSPPGHRPALMRHASPVATAEQSYQAFKKSVQQSRDLVSATATLPALQHNLVYELSFLRAVIAWEALVEEVFVTYLLRRPTRSGARLPSRLPARAVNKAGGSGGITVQMAGEILTGDRKFSDWLLEATVKERAKKWFPGDATFANAYAKFVDPLGRTHVKPFDDIVVVRNRIAHSSGTAAAKFLCAPRTGGGQRWRTARNGSWPVSPPCASTRREFVVRGLLESDGGRGGSADCVVRVGAMGASRSRNWRIQES